MFQDVNLPFNLIVTAKTSAPEQFERPPFLEAMLKAWAHRITSLRTRSANHHQMQNGRGCSNRTPRDSKRVISFHRLPLKNKPFLKEWLVRIIKRAAEYNSIINLKFTNVNCFLDFLAA